MTEEKGTAQLRIRELREDRDIPQKEVSELLMCDQSLYSVRIKSRI